MSRYIILSDIHGNMPALVAVVRDICDRRRGNGREQIKGIILLGDLIDYGMQSNEVVGFIRDELEQQVGASVVMSVWGNHEHVCLTGRDYDRLSSERTVASAKYTASILTGETRTYLESQMERSGSAETMIDNKRVFVVHGSRQDPLFGGIFPEDVHGNYDSYDVVFSGHTHFPHSFARFYPCDDDRLRRKKPTVFVNPGSVGQPRNRNPFAQYAVWDSESGQTELCAVQYDIEKAMSMYHGEVDDFYGVRLQYGV